MVKIDLEAVVMALVARAHTNGWLDGDDRASEVLRLALEEYTAPSEEEIAAAKRAEHVQEIDQRIAAWQQQAELGLP